ncbi:MAG: hypothetical protein K0R45_516 [Pseudomonas sp.]|jgi:hypothetical protein|nr:hypothetical protein [Pseudomonas sp.]
MNCLMRVMNPTTVIAIFAGLSEASATTVVPYLDGETRQLYIWFLIVFPSALVFMFFLTLNFNNKALYPPGGPCTCNYLVAAQFRLVGDLEGQVTIEHIHKDAPQRASPSESGVK